MHNSTPINIRFNNDQIDYIKRLARMMAVERDSDISYTDLIREAVELQYPMPKKKNEKQKDKTLSL